MGRLCIAHEGNEKCLQEFGKLQAYEKRTSGILGNSWENNIENIILEV
jgi:hypothetical protein